MSGSEGFGGGVVGSSVVPGGASRAASGTVTVALRRCRDALSETAPVVAVAVERGEPPSLRCHGCVSRADGSIRALSDRHHSQAVRLISGIERSMFGKGSESVMLSLRSSEVATSGGEDFDVLSVLIGSFKRFNLL